MAKIVGLPKLSPTMDEGTLVSWIKKEGDRVDVDDVLAEVETDKATMEFRSFDRGVLLKILVPEGSTLPPEAPVAIIGEEGEDITALIAEAEAQMRRGPTPSPTGPEPAAPAAPPASPAPAPGEASTGERVMASPLVRRLAREHDVQLSQLRGSGPRGRIVKTDLDAFLAGGGASAPAVPASRGDRVVKVSQMRKTIARRLTESKRDVPHYYLTVDVDVEPLMAARAAINTELKASGEKVSLNDMLIKACGVALARHPDVNASFLGESILYHGRVDISVAVAITDGLITPVVRSADQKGLAAISREVRDLVERAKDKRLQPEEFTNGTFSISNLGMLGIESFTAVINPPEGAILAVGTVRDEPVVKAGQLVAGKRMRLTLSCDHRVIDGATGAAFLATLKRFLQSPASMLI